MVSADGLPLTVYALLIFLAFGLLIMVARVYKPYKTFQSDRSIVRPFLIVGFLFAISVVTETIRENFPFGSIIHEVTMLAAGFFLVYGIYNYRKSLERLDVMAYAEMISKKMKKEIEIETTI